MQVPANWPKPTEGHYYARSCEKYNRGKWLIYDHTGRVRTESNDPGMAAYLVRRQALKTAAEQDS
jgi:hypothetical protein